MLKALCILWFIIYYYLFGLLFIIIIYLFIIYYLYSFNVLLFGLLFIGLLVFYTNCGPHFSLPYSCTLCIGSIGFASSIDFKSPTASSTYIVRITHQQTAHLVHTCWTRTGHQLPFQAQLNTTSQYRICSAISKLLPRNTTKILDLPFIHAPFCFHESEKNEFKTKSEQTMHFFLLTYKRW